MGVASGIAHRVIRQPRCDVLKAEQLSRLTTSYDSLVFHNNRTVLARQQLTQHQYSTTTTLPTLSTLPGIFGVDRERSSLGPFYGFLRGFSSSSVSHPTATVSGAKPHVVVLGTGWASVHFLRGIDCTRYGVSVISPRNYFTFTPLLPSVCSGTLSPLSCIEPIRTFTRRKGKVLMDFFEASCQDIDVVNKQIECSSKHGARFKLNYDYLVVAVGAESNTFGIKGVKEYAYFLKEVEHAQQIRKQVMDNFETAALPVTTPEERKRLLHFVIVGGGPTGIETAAEFADFIREDMSKYFPELIHHVTISLVEAQNKVLPMFSEGVSRYAADLFRNRLKIELLLEHAVTEITSSSIILKNNSPGANGKTEEVPYGFVLWASGVGQVPLCKRLMDLVPGQSGNRVLKVNQQMRVVGADDVYAMGDCSWMQPDALADSAPALLRQAQGSPQGPSTEWLASRAKELQAHFPQLSELKWNFKNKPSQRFRDDEFKLYLEQIDGAFRPPTPTAQNATQCGKYLAHVFNTATTPEAKKQAAAFVECWNGSLAYVGANQAVASLPIGDMLGGFYSLPFWKMIYMQMQLTWRTRTICLFDWMRTKCAGRDVGRDHSYY
eukprot:GHVS01090451.1.p1 GENE.GHVS01090451.1~~GHVS01090451.1.p1  ORF type:complete len:607 (+),score=58.88 GHVS01090451.1:240-2060(+)